MFAVGVSEGLPDSPAPCGLVELSEGLPGSPGFVIPFGFSDEPAPSFGLLGAPDALSGVPGGGVEPAGGFESPGLTGLVGLFAPF